LNRTAGARRGISYVGVSERSVEDGTERRQQRALRQKKKLIARAKLLAKTEQDYKSASRELTVLQAQWKAAGSAGRDHDAKLWARFRAPIDEFRAHRRRHFAELHRLAATAANTKQQLIAEAETLSSLTDYRQANTQFKNLMARWRETGNAGPMNTSLWERFTAARQAMYDATAEDRAALQAEYLDRVTLRIQHHREILGKSRSLRRELTMRRQHVIPGWIGMEMIEEFDERIADIDESIALREQWLEQDIQKIS
jgi:hypothetical protein